MSLQSDDMVMSKAENRKFLMYMYNNIMSEIDKHVLSDDSSQTTTGSEGKKDL